LLKYGAPLEATREGKSAFDLGFSIYERNVFLKVSGIIHFCYFIHIKLMRRNKIKI
jgi:hypothetical protein